MVCLNCSFPLVSILFLSNMLQCLILDLQSRIAHTQPPTIKLLAVLRLKYPRIYPKTNENEHRARQQIREDRAPFQCPI